MFRTNRSASVLQHTYQPRANKICHSHFLREGHDQVCPQDRNPIPEGGGVSIQLKSTTYITWLVIFRTVAFWTLFVKFKVDRKSDIHQL